MYKRLFLEKIVNAAWIIVVVLSIAMISMQVYIFAEYRRDVRDNRILLCRSAALTHEEFCTKARANNYDAK